MYRIYVILHRLWKPNVEVFLWRISFKRRDAVALRSDLILYSYGDWTANPAIG